MDKTYSSWMDGTWTSAQKEYTEPTTMLDETGKLLCAGYAKHNVFDYDRNRVRHPMRRKEWDFYQISNGKLMVQISFANISLGGYVAAAVVDIQNGKKLINSTHLFVGGKDKYPLPPKGDVPNVVGYKIGSAEFEFKTEAKSRTLTYKDGRVEASFQMDMYDDHQNLTTILPFDGYEDRFFMTTKAVCMPCSGYIKSKNKEFIIYHLKKYILFEWKKN